MDSENGTTTTTETPTANGDEPVETRDRIAKRAFPIPFLGLTPGLTVRRVLRSVLGDTRVTTDTFQKLLVDWRSRVNLASATDARFFRVKCPPGESAVVEEKLSRWRATV